MNWHKNLGTSVSMLFLLALTIVVAGIYYVAHATLNKIDDSPYQKEIKSLLK